MKKKILIIGSGSNVGRFLSLNLSDEFSIFEISSKKKYKSNPSVINLSLASKSLNLDKIRKIKKMKFSAIIFLSTIRQIDKSYKIFHIINNTIKLLKILTFEKFINFSSVSVYQKNTKKLYDVNSKLWPISNSDFEYSVNKIISEMYFFNYFEKSNINKFVNLRIGQIFGKSSKNQSIFYKLNQSIVDKKKFIIYGDGKRTITYILEKDLLFLIKKIIMDNSKHLNINAITSSTNIKIMIKDLMKNHSSKKLDYKFNNSFTESNERYKIKKNYDV